MNKKVSTILTVALTLGGSLLSSSAFATINTADLKVVSAADFVSGEQYYVVADVDGVEGLSKDDIMLSVKATGDEIDGSLTAALNSANLTFDTEGITFTITEVPSTSTANQMLYSFYSVDAKAYLALNETDNVITSIEDAGKSLGRFWQFNDGVNVLPEYTEGSLLRNNIGNHHNLYLANATIDHTGNANGAKIILCKANRSVSDSDLNDFFNNKGFNLAVEYDSDNYTLDENIFGGESRIWAFQVSEENCQEDNTGAHPNWDATKGYKISNAGANGEDLYIPEGMYFFTERVLKSGANVENLKAENIDWLASTLIYVSPTETVETTVEDRDEGQGFQLMTEKGSEFIFAENVSDYKVGDLPITNACFNVKDNNVGSYPFAISLPNFYYQADDDDDATEILTPKADMALGLIEFTTDNVLYLTTVKGAADNIFKFSDSALKDGKELLKTTKEAAVYAIKFVAGNTEDAKLINRYLTVAQGSSAFQWVAKGSAIANTSYPSFQYTITNVEDEDLTDKVEKYTKITFTNRETNESFTANLFPETSYGENCYSVALIAVNGNTTNPSMPIQPLKVVSNTYQVKEDGSATTLDENVIIKLEPVSVDEYAGFYNVDNESIRMIRFARDKFDTSNCWYAGAYENSLYNNSNPVFVEDIYTAAQFQLVKYPEATTIERTFVYNNTTTEDVDNVPNADKISAYKYALRYVNDGTATDYYLTGGQNANDDLDLVKVGTGSGEQAEPDYYYIKENADGSVSFFDDDDEYVFTVENNRGVRVANPGQSSVVTTSIINNAIKYNDTYGNGAEKMYAAESEDSDLKTYLDAEAPSLSWEGEGHVTLQNATGLSGDYITVNDDNEGVLVNDAAETFYLHETDKKAVVPSFYISLGMGEGSNAESERIFLFNPVDSVAYPVNMKYDPDYQLSNYDTKAIFKAGTLDASRDTMTIEGLKGEKKVIADEADNESVWGGLNRFKFQIIETEDQDGLYNIRQVEGNVDPSTGKALNNATVYLASNSQKLYFTTNKAYALAVNIEGVSAPTATEGVTATEVKVIALDGSINIKNAAGKNVVISTILGQIVANEVLTSDNATISVPAGIAIVSVEGEEAVKVSVR